MYFIDFCKRIFQKNNVMVVAYIIVNILVGALLLTGLSYIYKWGIALGKHPADFNFLKVLGVTLIISFVIYFISMLVNLSPIGEFIVRKKYKCKKIERADQISFIETQYRAVLELANAFDAKLSADINLYVVESAETMVYALGRNTLAVTTGLFDFPANKIRALIARELGHISQKDTDFLLLVTSGNFTVIVCIWLLRIFLYIALIPVFALAGICYVFGMLFGFLASFDSSGGLRMIGKALQMLCKPIPWIAKKLVELVGWIGRTLTNLWNKVGVSMVLKTRQGYEYSADEFAFNCGYGDILCDIILNDNLSDQGEGIFVDIVKAYPPSNSRLAKLQELGAEYSAY